jgi:hypothetical protein
MSVVERDMARRANGERRPLCASEWLVCAHGRAERSARICLEVAVVKLSKSVIRDVADFSGQLMRPTNADSKNEYRERNRNSIGSGVLACTPVALRVSALAARSGWSASA